jgi:tRNA pseudouridine55 synthase
VPAEPTQAGFVLLDKPPGPTSHDMVDWCRAVLGVRRVGHTGTLDPFASGLLCIAVGKASRLARFLAGEDKAYEADLVLGVETSTLDPEGEVVGSFDLSWVGEEDLSKAASLLSGEIYQMPPQFSARKYKGRRLYELARKGETAEVEPRRVRVSSLSFEKLEEPGIWRMKVVCSAGTYVRALARDLGRLLGGGAHLRSLRRTRLGSHTVAEAISPEELADRGWEAVRDPAEVLSHLPKLQIGAKEAAFLAQGRALRIGGAISDGQCGLAVDEAGRLVAVIEGQQGGEWLRPVVVMAG